MNIRRSTVIRNTIHRHRISKLVWVAVIVFGLYRICMHWTCKQTLGDFTFGLVFRWDQRLRPKLNLSAKVWSHSRLWISWVEIFGVVVGCWLYQFSPKLLSEPKIQIQSQFRLNSDLPNLISNNGTFCFLWMHWSIKITSLLIYALQLVREISDVYYCVSLY